MDNLDIFVTLGISAILASIKNPAKAANLKKAMLKVFNAIKAAYPNDPDFQ